MQTTFQSFCLFFLFHFALSETCVRTCNFFHCEGLIFNEIRLGERWREEKADDGTGCCFLGLGTCSLCCRGYETATSDVADTILDSQEDVSFAKNSSLVSKPFSSKTIRTYGVILCMVLITCAVSSYWIWRFYFRKMMDSSEELEEIEIKEFHVLSALHTDKFSSSYTFPTC